MKDACTKNGMRLYPERYGKLKFNINEMSGEAIHWLDEKYFETDTLKIGRLYGLLATKRL